MRRSRIRITFFTIMLISTISLFAGGFSANNLNEVPKKETYVFEGESSSKINLKAIIEYTSFKDKTDGEMYWKAVGKMQLKGTEINEEYIIRQKDMYITSVVRKQTFDRGSITQRTKVDVDIDTKSDEKYIISTLQGLMYILRAFPFHSRRVDQIEIFTAQQDDDAGGKVHLYVENKGLTKIKNSKYGVMNAFELEIRLDVPLVGMFIPKIRYYFRNDKQKTLLAMKGNLSFNQTSMNMELVSYKKED